MTTTQAENKGVIFMTEKTLDKYDIYLLIIIFISVIWMIVLGVMCAKMVEAVL